MFKNKRNVIGILLLLVAGLIVACQPQEVVVTSVVEVTRVVTETEVIEGQEVEVTRIVTETVVEEVVVTPEPEVAEPVSFDHAPDPTTYTTLVIVYINTIDPSLAYYTSICSLIENFI